MRCQQAAPEETLYKFFCENVMSGSSPGKLHVTGRRWKNMLTQVGE